MIGEDFLLLGGGDLVSKNLQNLNLYTIYHRKICRYNIYLVYLRDKSLFAYLVAYEKKYLDIAHFDYVGYPCHGVCR